MEVHAEHGRRVPRTLVDACAAALGQPASRFDVFCPECHEWPSTRSDEAWEHEDRVRRFTARFGFAPGPYDLELLWGLAQGFAIGLLAVELAACHGFSPKTIRRRVNEKFDPVIRLELPADARIDAERPRLVAKILGEFPPFRPKHLHRLDWPNLDAAWELRAGKGATRRSPDFLAPRDEELLDDFLALYVGLGGRRARGVGGVAKAGDQLRVARVACRDIAEARCLTSDEVADTVSRGARVLLAAVVDARRHPMAEQAFVSPQRSLLETQVPDPMERLSA